MALSVGFAVTACQPVPSASETSNISTRATLTPTEAGARFGPICHAIYPDLPAAIAAAERDGFTLDPSTGLFEHESDDLQMRINSEKCAIRFLTTTPANQLANIVIGFADGARPFFADGPGKQDVDIGTEDEGNGLTRVGATRNSAN